MVNLRPEVLVLGEVGSPFEADAFDDVVVFGDALDSSPEIPLIVRILMAKFESLRFDADALVNGKGGSYLVDEFDF